MTTLTWQIRENIAMKIADTTAENTFDLAALQKLTGGTLTDESDFACDARLSVRKPDSGAGCFLERPDFQLREVAPYPAFGVESHIPRRDQHFCAVWQVGMLLGWTSLMLKNQPLLPIHGTLLEMDDGTGVLFCAASGVGKSTTARRWCDAGGVCRADDMVLLDFSNDKIMAHPLPTWSRCREKLAGEFFPVETAIPLKSVLMLDRAEKVEEVLPVSPLQMMATIYFACTLFELEVLPKLPAAGQRTLADHAKHVAELLCDKFPSRALYAHLDGDLRQTLKDLS